MHDDLSLHTRLHRVAAAGAAIAALLAAGAVVAHLYLHKQAQAAEADLAHWQQRARADAEQTVPAPAPDARQAWLRRVTAEPPAVEALIAEVQRAGSAAGVTLGSVSTSRMPPSAQTMGRLDIALTLRGTHINLRTVLAELLDRYPGLVLQRLAFRRVAGPSNLEAQVALQLLSSSAAAPAPAPTR